MSLERFRHYCHANSNYLQSPVGSRHEALVTKLFSNPSIAKINAVREKWKNVHFKGDDLESDAHLVGITVRDEIYLVRASTSVDIAAPVAPALHDLFRIISRSFDVVPQLITLKEDRRGVNAYRTNPPEDAISELIQRGINRRSYRKE